MTKREKILGHLAENGVHVSEDKRWPKAGTVVVSGYMPSDTWRKLYFDLFKDATDRKIDIHRIRVRFEWMDAYRISWIGD